MIFHIVQGYVASQLVYQKVNSYSLQMVEILMTFVANNFVLVKESLQNVKITYKRCWWQML